MKNGQNLEEHVMLLDCWEDWLGLPALISRVKKERKYTYGDTDEPLLRSKIVPAVNRPKHQGRPIDIILIEDKGSGISLRQALAAENILTEGYNPGRDDKLTRLHLVSPCWPHGRVWAAESKSFPGQFVSWADPLISQICSYTGPGSTERDDLLDTATQALRLVMDKFMGPFTHKVSTEQKQREAALEEQRHERSKRNPYAS